MPIPKGDSIGRVEFLLEDYIPERLDFTLKPAKPIIDPGEPVELSLDARFLYGAPASGLDVTGAIRLEAVEGAALAGYPGLCRRPRRRRFHHRRKPVHRQGPDRRQGPRRPLGRPARGLEHKAPRGQADRRRRRARRAHGRAHRHPAGAGEERDDRRQARLRRVAERRRCRDVRSDRRRAGRRARRAERARNGRSIR